MSSKLEKQTNIPTRIDFNPEQVNLIKSQVARGASDDELNLFLHQCRRSGLDPLARQIYFMKRKIGNEYRMTVQTSIDGFRVIAERSGNYAGQDEPIFIMENDKVIGAKIPVYKFRGQTRYLAAVGVAYMEEYMPSPGQDFMWKKMPRTMISKVAEALALRKAYPMDLSGLYTDDEMEQANVNTPIIILDSTNNQQVIPDYLTLIENCNSITELTHLFNDFKQVFDDNVHLKQKLTERKNYLKSLVNNKIA
jgi:phage recombination protein Bet